MFTRELNLIDDVDIREDVRLVISKLPDYFWEIPASSTGKYHPKYSLAERGLVRHIKVAVRIAEDLLQLDQFNFGEYEKDLIIASLILHDGLKYGLDYNVSSYFKHPLYMANYLLEILNEGEFKSSRETIIRIAHIISTHMGQWNTSKYDTTVLPTPSDKVDEFVHMCDYLASRRYLNVEFDVNNEII